MSVTCRSLSFVGLSHTATAYAGGALPRMFNEKPCNICLSAKPYDARRASLRLFACTRMCRAVSSGLPFYRGRMQHRAARRMKCAMLVSACTGIVSVPGICLSAKQGRMTHQRCVLPSCHAFRFRGRWTELPQSEPAVPTLPFLANRKGKIPNPA